MFRYYVVEHRGEMKDEAQLAREFEQLLNQHATQGGWELDRIVGGDVAKTLGFSETMALVIFRKPK